MEPLLGRRGCQTPMQSTHSRKERGDKGVQVAQAWAWLNLVLVVVLARLDPLAVLPRRLVALLPSFASRGPTMGPGHQPFTGGWLVLAGWSGFGATRAFRRAASAVDQSTTAVARRLEVLSRGPLCLLRPALLTLPCSPSGRVRVRTRGL